jgi:N-acyl-D-aspartate/D-glutamate deacylase
MAGSGALYASHIRNEGDGLLEAIAEAIAIGDEAGVPVQISHHKATGRANWGRVRDSLRLIDEARARGLDVTADQYPYTAGSTTLAAFVAVSKAGEGPIEPDALRIASAPHHPEWDGRTLSDIARELDLTPDAAADHIVAEERDGAIAILDSMDEADVRTVLAHPTTMIGSDGLPATGGKPHPRLYGTFPRVLGHYARDEGVLDLAEAVHRMTGLPAAKFGLDGRGTIRPGAFADLVMFQAGTIADTATYDDPRRYPTGVVTVWVNGEVVVHDGALTGARPGRALRRTAPGSRPVPS